MAALGVQWGDPRGESHVIACHVRDVAQQTALVAALKMFAAVQPSVEGEMLAHAWCQAHGLPHRVSGRSNDGWEVATGIDALWFDVPVPVRCPVTTLVRASNASFVPGAIASWLVKQGGGATVFLGDRKLGRGGLTVRAWAAEPEREAIAERLRALGATFGETAVVVEGSGPTGEVDASIAVASPTQAAKALAKELGPQVDLLMLAARGHDAAWRAFDIDKLVTVELA